MRTGRLCSHLLQSTGVADPTGVYRVLRPTVVAGVPCLVGLDEAMGWLVRRGEQRAEGRGQVGLILRQEPWARRGRGQEGGEAPEGTFPSKRLVECLSVWFRLAFC